MPKRKVEELYVSESHLKQRVQIIQNFNRLCTGTELVSLYSLRRTHSVFGRVLALDRNGGRAQACYKVGAVLSETFGYHQDWDCEAMDRKRRVPLIWDGATLKTKRGQVVHTKAWSQTHEVIDEHFFSDFRNLPMSLACFYIDVQSSEFKPVKIECRLHELVTWTRFMTVRGPARLSDSKAYACQESCVSNALFPARVAHLICRQLSLLPLCLQELLAALIEPVRIHIS